MITKPGTHRHWLEQNWISVNDYLYGWVDEHARGGMWRDPPHLATPGTVRYDFFTNPYLGREIVQDWINNTQSIETNQERLLNTIRKEETYVILVTGMGGAGKGSSVWYLLWRLKDEFNIKVVTPIKSDAESYPQWAEPITNIGDMANGDLVLYDEAGVRSSARRSMSKENEASTAWLPVGRHSGAKVIYISQFASITDKNIMRFTNIHISKGFSSSAFGQEDNERASIAKNPIYEYFQISPGDHDYARVPSTHKDWGIVKSGSGAYLCYLPMPQFYSEKLSKPFRKYIDKAGGNQENAERIALTDAQIMLDDGLTSDIIELEMRIRGYRQSKKFWRTFCGEDKGKKGDDLLI